MKLSIQLILCCSVQVGELKKYIEVVDLCVEAKDYFTENMPENSDTSHFVIG